MIDVDFLDVAALLELDCLDDARGCGARSPGEHYICTRWASHEDEHIAFARVPIVRVVVLAAIWK